MLFNYVLGIQEVNSENTKVNCREAVRGIILHNDNILMVHSNEGDYKLPGGGIKTGESHKEALGREVREETGYIIGKVTSKAGIVIERNVDVYEANSIFEMISYYYSCEITDNQEFQQLDDYEKELEFCPIWINIDKAIHFNEEILKRQIKSRWVYRETLVLKALRDHIRRVKSEQAYI